MPAKNPAKFWRSLPTVRQLEDGTRVREWVNDETGERRIIEVGQTPQTQPNAIAPVYADETEEAEDDEPETAEERVIAMIGGASDLPAEATLKVYRRRADSAKLDWCMDMQPREFGTATYEILRRKYGAGEYEIRLYGPNPNNRGRTGLLAAESVGIAQPLDEDPTPAAQSQNLDRVFELFTAQVTRMQEENRQMIAQIVSQREDPMKSFAGNLALMAQVRDLFGAGQRSSIAELVDGIKELKGAKSLIGGDEGDSEPGMMQIGAQLLDVLKASATAQSAAPLPVVTAPQAMHHFSQPAQPSQTVAPAEQPAEHGTDMNVMELIRVKAFATRLEKRVKSNERVESIADFVLDDAPDIVIDTLILPEWFDVLAQFVPDAAMFKDRLSAIRALVLDGLEGENLENQAETATPDPGTVASEQQ